MYHSWSIWDGYVNVYHRVTLGTSNLNLIRWDTQVGYNDNLNYPALLGMSALGIRSGNQRWKIPCEWRFY